MQVTLNKQKTAMKKSESADVTVVCIRCGKKDCIRIKRGSFVKALFFWLPLKHFHCQNCLRNFYGL